MESWSGASKTTELFSDLLLPAHPFSVQWVWLGFFLIFLTLSPVPGDCYSGNASASLCGTEQDYEDFVFCCFYYIYIMFFMLLWTERNSGSYNGEVSLKKSTSCCQCKGQRERVLSCFLHILVCHCPALPFCTEGICVENIEQKWDQPEIPSCWSCDKEFKNLEQLLLLPNQLSKEPLQGRVWMGRKWLLRAENKQNSEIFTWNSSLKMHWKGLFFFF